MSNLFHRLMAEVMTNLSMPAQATEEGVYIIGVDKNIDIHIGCPDNTSLFIFSHIGVLAESERDSIDVCKTLLGLNALTISWTPTVWLSADDNIAIWTRTNLASLSMTNAVNLISQFIDAAIHTEQLLHMPSDEPMPLEKHSPPDLGAMRG